MDLLRGVGEAIQAQQGNFLQGVIILLFLYLFLTYFEQVVFIIGVLFTILILASIIVNLK